MSKTNISDTPESDSNPVLTLDDIGRRHGSTRVVSWPLRQLWLNVDYVDQKNVPADGPVILVANHLSFLDSVLLLYCLDRRVTFLGKVEYLSSRATASLFPAAGMIPVDRTGRGIAKSLAMAEQRLRDGEVVGIFPEGSRSRDGLLHRGHVGAAHLALRTGAPIVPVGIVGTDVIQPAGKLLPKFRGEATLKFGSAIDLGPWVGSGRSGGAKREITDEVMRSIASLSGQSMSDVYLEIPGTQKIPQTAA